MNTGIDYFAGAQTIIIWPSERPQARRVLSAKDTASLPNPLFALAAELVRQGATSRLACFVRHDVTLDILAHACAAWCEQNNIADLTRAGERALALAERLEKGDPRELARRPDPTPDLDFVATWADLHGLLEE